MLKLARLIGMVALAVTLTACVTETSNVVPPLDLVTPQGEIMLEVRGSVARINSSAAAQFDMDMLKALPSVQLRTSTSVTDGPHMFEGVLIRDFLKSLDANGSIVKAIARNQYFVDIPVTDFERYGAIIAYHMDGAPIAVEDKGPLWIIYPRDAHRELQDIRYDYRWVWQLEALEIR